jgi:hypothetical protein
MPGSRGRSHAPADDLGAVEGWQIHADPAGHPFCLCWHRTALPS